MAKYVWLNSTNLKQQYVTSIAADPNVPAGYILTGGSDGAPDAALQQYVAGVNSGGFPAYTGDAAQAANPQGWINGIFTSKPGGATTG